MPVTLILFTGARLSIKDTVPGTLLYTEEPIYLIDRPAEERRGQPPGGRHQAFQTISIEGVEMKNTEPCYPKAFIPYGAWGGSWFPAWHTSPLAEVDIARFAAEAMPYILGKKNVPLSQLDYLVTGSTIPWHYKFWGSTYLSHTAGHRLPGFHLEQACATGLQVMVKAAAQVQGGSHGVVGVLAFDKTSNSPACVFPNQGTYRRTEVISDVWDNFGYDPSTGQSGFDRARGETSMLACAGRTARKYKLDFKEVAELSYWRYQQYFDAKKSGVLDRVLLPMTIMDARGRKLGVVDDDYGVRQYRSLDQFKSERQLDTCVAAGGQTHPSDGMFTILFTTEEKARELSQDPAISIQLIASNEYRAEAGYMPESPGFAVKALLERTGLEMADMVAVYDHNPFVINDLVFARLLDYDWHKMNDTGCPLIYGHPQGPTLIRVTVEALERAVSLGGGYVLIFGCAAGDVGISAIFKVTERKG
jgi:acetyl-CoA acetyltransferase